MMMMHCFRFCFIEFVSVKDATNAVEQTNTYRLDKQHVFSVCKFSEFQRIVAVKLHTMSLHACMSAHAFVHKKGLWLVCE